MSPSLREIATCLIEGGVVLIPTDTVLGLAVSPAHPGAMARLYAMKNRPQDKNLPIMVADADQITALGAEINDTARALLQSPFMPGALTVVLPLGPTPATWLAERREIALRIPDHDLLRAVLRETGPLLVTSANLSGADTPTDPETAAASLTQRPDLVVPGRGRLPTPSTIVNTCTTPLRIERHGAVPEAAIHALLEARHG